MSIEIIEQYRARAVQAEQRVQILTNTLIATLLAAKVDTPLTISKNTLNQVPKYRVKTKPKGKSGAFVLTIAPIEEDDDA